MKRAGFNPTTKGSAAAFASILKKEPAVAAEIAALEARNFIKAELTAERVLEEIRRLALANPQVLFNEDGSLKPITEWRPEDAAFVASFEVEEIWGHEGRHRVQVGELKKVRLWSKPEAIKMAAQHLALLVSRLELTGKDGGPVEVQSVKFGDREIKF